ncbi:transposase [Streptomyces sp. NPDC051018]|uniref:transposase n=1 Tax=Streptomyces sp. NPDC051018 TaxID=3365639 RepID=UPI0037980582
MEDTASYGTGFAPPAQPVWPWPRLTRLDRAVRRRSGKLDWIDARAAARALPTALSSVVSTHNPGPQTTYGVGPDLPAQLLITAGGNPDRLRTEASFVALCGVVPVPGPSGETTPPLPLPGRRPGHQRGPPSNSPRPNGQRAAQPRIRGAADNGWQDQGVDRPTP